MNIIEGEIEGIPLVVIEGELEHGSKQVARDVMRDILGGPYPPPGLLIDLTDCTFLDSGGISVLLSALSQLPEDGWLGLINVSGGTARVLTYAGLRDSDKVRFFSSSSDAAATLARERRLNQE